MSIYEHETSKSQQNQEIANEESQAVSELRAEVGEPGEAEEIPYSLEALKEAMQAGDSEKISGMLNCITEKDMAEIVGDTAAMNMIDSLDDVTRNAVYDKIYMAITDVDTLCVMAKKRLGVAFGRKYSDDEKALNNATSLLRSVIQDASNKSYKSKPDDTLETLEKDWPLEGAQHLYSVLMKAPESHLQKLKIVMVTDSNSGGGAGGLAYSNLGVYLIKYDNNKIDTLDNSIMFHGDKDENGKEHVIFTDMNGNDIGEGRFTINGENANSNHNRLNNVIAHEFGHVVDYGHSPNYSSMESYRKITGWKEYYHAKSEDGAAEIVKDLRSYMSRPDPESLAGNKDATELIDLIAQELVMDDAGPDELAAKVDDVLNGGGPVLTTENMDSNGNETLEEKEARLAQLQIEYKKNNYDSTIWREQIMPLQAEIKQMKRRAITNPVVDRIMAENEPDEKFADTLKSAPILDHIVHVTTGMDPWFYYEPLSNLDKGRQLHANYAGKWYSYDESARAHKLSNYQFCDPAEEFAE